jgi:hemolysin activation/secretion protein
MAYKYAVWCLISLVLAFTSLDGLAADPGSFSGLSNTDTASVIENRIREEKKDFLEEEKKEETVEVEVKAEPKSVGSELRFFINKIQLEGMKILPESEFLPLLQAYEKKESSLGELNEVAREITAKYNKKGYITSLAYIPPQEIKDGILIIRIIEGTVGEQRVQDNRFFRRKQILSYSTLEPGEVVNVGKIQKVLTRLNENPDREVNASLVAGKEAGTSDIIFKVKDKLPIHGSLSYDNLGTPSSGKKRFGVTLVDNNLTSLDDSLAVGTLFGQFFGFVFAQYSLPIPRTHTKWVSGFVHGQVHPQKTLKPFGVSSISQTYYSRIEQPLIETSQFAMKMNVGMEFKEGRTMLNSGTFKRERLRLIRFGPKFTLGDRGGTTEFENDFYKSVNGLGAAIYEEPGASRQGVQPAFFQYRGQITRFQKMPFKTQSLIKLQFQHSSRKLPSQQEMYFGGADSIRGYPEADYLADTGIILNFEYYIPAFFFKKEWKLPYSKTALRDQIQLVGFFDEGYGRLRGPSNIEEPDRHMVGVGGGLKILLYQHLYLRTDWGYALGDHPINDPGRHQFYVRLQAEK